MLERSNFFPVFPLPEEDIFNIYSHLGPIELANMARINKLSKKISLDNDLWKHLYAISFPEKSHELLATQAVWRVKYIENARKAVKAFNLHFYVNRNNLASHDFKKIVYADFFTITIKDKSLLLHILATMVVKQDVMDALYEIIKSHYLAQPASSTAQSEFYQDNEFGFNLVHWVVVLNQLKLINAILMNNYIETIDTIAMSKQLTRTNKSCLYLACEYGHSDMVLLLLKSGAVVDLPDSFGYTPLMLAARNGFYAVVTHLIDYRAKINAKSNTPGRTALYFAAQQGRVNVMTLLIQKGALVDEPDVTNQWTPFLTAVANGNDASVNLLLNQGANIHARNNYSETALYLTAEQGHVEKMKLLLNQKDVELNAVSCNGWTPLLTAAFRGHEECVSLLLAKGADPNLKSYVVHGTALFAAVQIGSVRMVKALLNHHANPGIALKDVAYRLRETTINLNALTAMNYFIDDCLRHGVSANNISVTPFEFAVILKRSAIIQAFAEKFASITQLTSKANILAVIAAYNGDIMAIKLLSKSVNFNQPTVCGIKPINVAKEQKQEKIIAFMEHAINQDNKSKLYLSNHALFASSSTSNKEREKFTLTI